MKFVLQEYPVNEPMAPDNYPIGRYLPVTTPAALNYIHIAKKINARCKAYISTQLKNGKYLSVIDVDNIPQMSSWDSVTNTWNTTQESPQDRWIDLNASFLNSINCVVIESSPHNYWIIEDTPHNTFDEALNSASEIAKCMKSNAFYNADTKYFSCAKRTRHFVIRGSIKTDMFRKLCTILVKYRKLYYL